jgi:predicted DCC family thiol-disulfide oxidoreductase YuxK
MICSSPFSSSLARMLLTARGVTLAFFAINSIPGHALPESLALSAMASNTIFSDGEQFCTSKNTAVRHFTLMPHPHCSTWNI